MDKRWIEQVMAEFESMGIDHVRLWLRDTSHGTSVYAKQKRAMAIEWLSRYEKEDRLRSESSQEESLATAKSAKDAAWEAAEASQISAREAQKANLIATCALIAAVIAIAISVLNAFLGK